MRLITFLIMTLFIPVRALTAELLVIEQQGCIYCIKWNEEIRKSYPKTALGEFAPLKFADINNLPDEIELISTVIYTPTFILLKNSKELGRVEGYSGEEIFWFLIEDLFETYTEYQSTY